MFLKQIFVIALGGAIGSACRFITSYQINQWLGARFPYGVLLVNVLGCLFIGFLGVLFVDRMVVSTLWRAGILIGFLGGFTTFSTFTFDTFNLFEQGDHVMALLNVCMSVLLCLLATVLGVFLGRSL